MVDERGYCTDCDSSDCLHAQLHDALAQAAYWRRKATERKVEPRKATSSDAAGDAAYDSVKAKLDRCRQSDAEVKP